MIAKFATLIRPFIRAFEALTPLGDLLARIWVAQIFFRSGLVKISSWDTTMMLFQHVYHVPLMSPTVAAVFGTIAELILPILLILGLGGRIVIFIFFCYNIIAASSYSFLWTLPGVAGLEQHVNWALLLMLLMFHGSGKWSLDYFIRLRHGHHLVRHTR